MSPSRRSVLQLSAIALSGGLAGCSTGQSGLEDNGTQTPTSSPTASARSPTESTRAAPDLSLSAAIFQQPSTAMPAEVEVRLSNEGAKEVELGYGPALLFTDNSASDDLQWPENLVIDPETNVGPWKDPVRTADSCWRYPEDASRPVQSILEWRTLDAGESLSERYEVYTDSDADSCLPQGSYRFQDKGYVEKESRSMVLTLVLEVDDTHQLTARTEEPHITSDDTETASE